MPREELRNRLKLKAAPFLRVMTTLSEQDVLSADGALAWLPSHSVKLSDDQQSRVDAYLELLRSDPFSPPTDSPLDPELLAGIEAAGTVVRAGDVVFHREAFTEMCDRVKTHSESGGEISISEVRELFGSSRKYVLAFLEELDRRGITIRRGDDRILR